MGRGSGTTRQTTKSRTRTVGGHKLNTSDLKKELRELSSSPNVLAYGASEYSKAFDIEYDMSGGIFGHCSCDPDDFCRCARIEGYDWNGFSSNALAEEIYEFTNDSVKTQEAKIKHFYTKTKSGKAAAEKGLSDEESVLLYALETSAKDNRKTGGLMPTGHRQFRPQTIFDSGYRYVGESDDYETLQNESYQRFLEPKLVARIKAGQDSEYDQETLKTLLNGLMPEDLEPTKTPGIYGEESGPVYIDRTLWNGISERYEDYLNNTVAGDEVSIQKWLDANPNVVASIRSSREGPERIS